MRYLKKFETSAEFNNFTLDYTNTPNVSLIEELSSILIIFFKNFNISIS